jgi:hypothetical protein
MMSVHLEMVVLKMEFAWLGNARFRKPVDHEFGACRWFGGTRLYGVGISGVAL